jgi:hypothetical protein
VAEKIEPRIVRKLRAKYSAQRKRACDKLQHAEAMLYTLMLECGHPALKIKREWWGIWAHCPDCHAGRNELELTGITLAKLEEMIKDV